MFERLSRGTIKLLRGAIWTGLSYNRKSPDIDVLHQSSIDGTVLCVHGPAYIEPEGGYIVTEDGFLLERSLLTTASYHERPWKYFIPSPSDFWRNVRNSTNVITVPEVISFRNFWEWNYYHFYFDVLSKLELLQHAGFHIKSPIALAKYADDVNFVRPLTKRGKLANYQWLNPGKKYIRAEKIILCQTTRPYKNRISYLCNALQIKEKENAYETDRIFLNRSNRCLSNFDELLPILKAYQFKIVDTATMDMDEQINLFANVRYLVAIHGAGTTNIIFRGDRPLNVLELHSDKYMNFDHKRICEEMGYCWDQLEGKVTEGKGTHTSFSLSNFSISPDALDQKLKEFLR